MGHRKLIVLLCFFLWCTGSLCAFCQGNTGCLTKLKKFSTDHISEKVYLHFDKSYYQSGDTIYFKAYLTLNERHILSPLSGVLHVDLIDIKNHIGQSIRLHVINGITWGDFVLADSLPAGYYRIRAYTRLMHNSGDSSCFYKTIPVGALNRGKIPESGIAQQKYPKPGILFFPEAGELVAGIRSKVAFKAIDHDGLGIDVKGVVTDGDNNAICSFSSMHLGMGYFYIDPEEGQAYKAMITYADGSHDVVELPKPNKNGITFSVNNDSIPNATVMIKASRKYFMENKNKDYSLVIYSCGIATAISFPLDSQIMVFDIIKRRLYTGIATFTLFSPGGEPLAERLLFVQNYDQLKLGISNTNTPFLKRGKTTIELHANDWTGKPAAGHFSVAVVDESNVPGDENNNSTILSYLLLTSDLKGYVEQPNYYFSDTTSNAPNALDVLMLTQGYRQFEWKKVLNNSYPAVATLAEKGIEMGGIVKTTDGKPVAGGHISLVSFGGGQMLSQVTDNNGNFSFNNLLFADTAHFVLKATTADGKTHTHIIINKYPAPELFDDQAGAGPQIMNELPYSYSQPTSEPSGEFYKYDPGKSKLLKEVTIRSKIIKPLINDTRFGFPDQLIAGDQLVGAGLLATSLMGKLNGIDFVWNDQTLSYDAELRQPRTGALLIVVDGSEMPGDFNISSIYPDQVKNIELFINPTVATPLYSGVLYISTKYGQQSKKGINSNGVLAVTTMGFYKAREFYSPKYDVIRPSDKKSDLRSTIFWQPELSTDNNGIASFSYYNADSNGKYRIVIEGIDSNGNIGRQTFTYTVE